MSHGPEYSPNRPALAGGSANPDPNTPGQHPSLPAQQQLRPPTIEHGERYWRILQNNVEWLRFSETKASIILTSYGVLFTIIYTNAVAVFSSINHPGAVRWFVVLFGTASLTSIVSAFLTIRPRLRNTNPTSILYFRHIFKKYQTASAYKQAAHLILDDENLYTDHLTEQIHTISKVANSKYVCAGIAVWAFAISLALLVITVLIYVNSSLTIPTK